MKISEYVSLEIENDIKRKGGLSMTNVAIVLALGFEETEALVTVDVLRRASIDCDVIGFEGEVTGAHNITIKADKLLADTTLENYDLLALPGGMPGAKNLRDNKQVIAAIQTIHGQGKAVAAICAAPIVLERAGLLNDKHYTCFPGFEEEIQAGKHEYTPVVVDDNIITSRGPATAFEFAFAIVDYLGGNSTDIKEAMQYNFLIDAKS